MVDEDYPPYVVSLAKSLGEDSVETFLSQIEEIDAIFYDFKEHFASEEIKMAKITCSSLNIRTIKKNNSKIKDIMSKQTLLVRKLYGD